MQQIVQLTTIGQSHCPVRAEKNWLWVQPASAGYTATVTVNMPETTYPCAGKCFDIMVSGIESLDVRKAIEETSSDVPVNNLAVFFLNDIGHKEGMMEDKFIPDAHVFLSSLFDEIVSFGDNNNAGFNFDPRDRDMAFVPTHAILPWEQPEFASKITNPIRVANYLDRMNSWLVQDEVKNLVTWAENEQINGYHKIGVIVTWKGTLLQNIAKLPPSLDVLILDIGSTLKNLPTIKSRYIFSVGEPDDSSRALNNITARENERTLAQFKERVKYLRGRTRQVVLQLPENIHPPVNIVIRSRVPGQSNCDISLILKEESYTAQWRILFLIVLGILMLTVVIGLIPFLGHSIIWLLGEQS
jgi:hypothetical protein